MDLSELVTRTKAEMKPVETGSNVLDYMNTVIHILVLYEPGIY
jgi:hypothetical protein